MKLTSSAFEEKGEIPPVYTCDGENRVPPLAWDGVPENTESLVLIMDDPDIPDSVKEARGIEIFDHWVVFNILPEVHGVQDGEEPMGTPGLNGAGKTGYMGPCPPDREHRYFFHLYALDTLLNLPPGATKDEVKAALSGHVIAEAELVGLYNRLENRK